MPTKCTLCPRQCGAERGPDAGNGLCGMGMLPVVARAALHFGEEPCISGTRGSGAIFFCGCAMGCVYCQNVEISRDGKLGRVLTPAQLASIFMDLERQGAHNINLVTASHFVPAIALALRLYRPSIPVVYNSSGYESLETLAMLEGLVDVYLPDYKYADPSLADFCSSAPDYPQVALAAIQEMCCQRGPCRYSADGLLLSGILVRHLVLPGTSGASMRALNTLREALPADVPLSLMGQYTPRGRALHMRGLDRSLLPREYARVAAHMRALEFPGYVQSPESTGDAMIPVWDQAGIHP